MLHRRTFLAAGSALLAAPSHATGTPDLRALLDSLDPTKPAEALRQLEAFNPAPLQPSERLDYDAVRWGLRIDAQIADGDRSFATLFERQFGARIDATALHRRFGSEGAGLTTRADALLRGQGLTQGNVGERLRAFARQERWLYSDDAAGRDAAVAAMNRWLAVARSRLGDLVSAVPAAAHTATVRALTAADIAAGRQGYRQAATADSPAIYYVDLREIRRRPSWSLPSVVHHEMLPGHLPQALLQEAAAPHPLRLRYAPSFAEGWSIHAEQLADQAGLLAADTPAMIGYLQWMLFRIGRGLVDIGVHFDGWDDARATAFFADLQGDPMIFAPFALDLEKLRKAPGARAAEVFTALAMGDLSAGRTGSLAAFNHAMLADGALPFALLSRNVRPLGSPQPPRRP